MDESQTLRSMVRDDAYQVIRVLADGPSGKTELVTLDGEGPLVRKSMPTAIANAAAWAAAMDIDEPLLPRIESLYRMPDKLVVVYDYVEGQSAAEVVETSGPLAPAHAAKVMYDVCRAVSALHERGVVHRDITPGNVILAKDGAHLVDLGIARQQVQQRTHDTTTLGTWGFASPEQYGFAQTDARSDVYSLGKLLGYLLTGCKPDTERYETTLNNGRLVDQALAEVVYKATSFEPSARYQSAHELSEAVRAALRAINGEPAASGEERFATTRSYQHASYAKSTAPEGIGGQNTRSVGNHDAPVDPEASRIGASAPVAPQYASGAFTDAPTTSPASQRAPRAFADAPKALRILAIIYWVVLGLFALIIAIGSIDIYITGEPETFGTAQYLMSFSVIAGTIMLACEAFSAVTYAKPYTGNEHPVKLFARRSVVVMLITLALMFIAAIVFPG